MGNGLRLKKRCQHLAIEHFRGWLNWQRLRFLISPIKLVELIGYPALDVRQSTSIGELPYHAGVFLALIFQNDEGLLIRHIDGFDPHLAACQ